MRASVAWFPPVEPQQRIDQLAAATAYRTRSLMLRHGIGDRLTDSPPGGIEGIAPRRLLSRIQLVNECFRCVAEICLIARSRPVIARSSRWARWWTIAGNPVGANGIVPEKV
jgi:hypothetical protein